MKVVLLGGTSGMGRAIGRQLSARGEEVFLLGIGPEDLEKSATDFSERGGGKHKVGYAECDLERPETFQMALDQAHAKLGGYDTVIVTAGLFGTQERLEQDAEFTRRLLMVNFTNTVVFCELARKYLLARGGGTLCAFSSVAGDRGRKPVVLYGASKAGLSAYLEGLDHRYRAAGLRTLCVKPGFVRTSMTEGLKAPPFAGEPEGVAQQVITAIDRGTPVVYAPPIWAWVMRVIRSLPRFVMRKVQF
jgi:decaprenylphospho-beta-D-erythro-pentofuranosid-2-ulose 2-reductase